MVTALHLYYRLHGWQTCSDPSFDSGCGHERTFFRPLIEAVHPFFFGALDLDRTLGRRCHPAIEMLVVIRLHIRARTRLWHRSQKSGRRRIACRQGHINLSTSETFPFGQEPQYPFLPSLYTQQMLTRLTTILEPRCTDVHAILTSFRFLQDFPIPYTWM